MLDISLYYIACSGINFFGGIILGIFVAEDLELGGKKFILQAQLDVLAGNGICIARLV